MTTQAPPYTGLRVELHGDNFYLVAGSMPVYHAIGPSDGDPDHDRARLAAMAQMVEANPDWHSRPPRACDRIAYSIGVEFGLQAEPNEQ